MGARCARGGGDVYRLRRARCTLENSTQADAADLDGSTACTAIYRFHWISPLGPSRRDGAPVSYRAERATVLLITNRCVVGRTNFRHGFGCFGFYNPRLHRRPDVQRLGIPGLQTKVK